VLGVADHVEVMAEDDKSPAELSEKTASKSANCSLIAQIFRTANDGKPFVVPKRGRWQRVRNIIFETELEDSYHGCEVTENFSQHISIWSVTVMLGLGW
jgi:hypothetical protein